MKRFLLTLAASLILAGPAMFSQVVITKVDQVDPTEEMFIDMATVVATDNLKEAGQATGAVVILNNAYHANGRGTATLTAEEAALAKTRARSLQFAKIYTVNEPTTEALKAISKAGVGEVVFVNSRDKVVKAGIYPASAYDDAAISQEEKVTPMRQIVYGPAEDLLNASK